MNANLEQIVGKAILDKSFRAALLENPEAALKEAGIDLSAEELKSLQAGLESIKQETDGKNYEAELDVVAKSAWI